MAIWITRTLEDGSLRLRVEGQIVGDWSTVLERELHVAERHGREILVDLSGVTYVDTAGLARLRLLRASGARLVRVPPLIEEAVAEDQI